MSNPRIRFFFNLNYRILYMDSKIIAGGILTWITWISVTVLAVSSGLIFNEFYWYKIAIKNNSK